MTYRQLTREQRYMIHALKQEGCTQTRIGEIAHVHKSTVSRELKRNISLRGYRPATAHRLAMTRRSQTRKPTKLTPRVKARLRSYLTKEWSPEQIAGRLSLRGGLSISHQTIYRYVRQDKKDNGSLYKHLRRQRPYRKRYAGKPNAPCVGRVSIDERPAVVDERSRLGDWEVDTIVSGDRKSAIVSMVERVSKLTLLGRVPRKNARNVSTCIIHMTQAFRDRVLTITSDNGAEFAEHRRVSDRLQADFYFAHPYKSWERGLNENTNGLVRQYLPKRSSFERLTDRALLTVTRKLNHRPRKTLGYLTPSEVFYGIVALGT